MTSINNFVDRLFVFIDKHLTSIVLIIAVGALVLVLVLVPKKTNIDSPIVVASGVNSDFRAINVKSVVVDGHSYVLAYKNSNTTSPSIVHHAGCTNVSHIRD